MRWPRSVLLVHNRYREAGGEDRVFNAECELLERRGHEVARLVLDNSEIPVDLPPISRLGLAVSTIWSRRSRRRLQEIIGRLKPDLAHFHNTFPLVSPACYSICKERAIPVVQTLHNYRLMCPNGLFFRDGRLCQDCLGRMLPSPGIVHGCYHSSRAETSVVAAMLFAHNLRRTWKREVDIYIALTEFARNQFILGGLNPDRIAIKPNFVHPDPGQGSSHGEFLFFAGRFVDYKGVDVLLRAWMENDLQIPLRLAGDGPLLAKVRLAARNHKNIEYLGSLPHSAILREMHGAVALIFPSRVYETFGLSIVEAFSCGVPVIASGQGAMAEIVQHMRTGILFSPGDAQELAAKARWAWSHPTQLRSMRENARREFEKNYTADANYDRLMSIYQAARSSRELGAPE